MKNTNSKGFVPIIIIAFVAVLAIAMVGVGIYFKVENDKQIKEQKNTNQVVANTSATTNTNTTNQNANTNMATDDTTGWKTYTNTKYGYSVKYPQDGSFNELTSGTEGENDKGYIVDFNIKGMSIRITAYKNSRGDKTLEQLIEVRNNVGVPLFVDNSSDYQTINIGGQQAFKYLNYLNGDKKSKRIGADTLLLEDEYYYQITTGNQYAPEFTADKENTYDAFVGTFQFTDETAGWETYKNEDLGIKFNYPQSITTPTLSPGINGNESLPVKEWQDVVITVGNYSLSFTTRQNYRGGYERAWSNTFYSKGIDLDQNATEIKTTLSEYFRNIDGFSIVAESFIEFYQLGQYGEDYSLLYRAIKPSLRYGSIIGTYVIKNDFFQSVTFEHTGADPQAVSAFANEVAAIQNKSYNQDVLGTIQVLQSIMLSLSEI